ncbi:PIN domain-containing protein [Candidatus Palauibacter sp.]|uniref:PIN domain-containing protein n=1 Tax=Candidatus Palauibacter sp. TaxID=3101350 RepID=UPI003B02C418
MSTAYVDTSAIVSVAFAEAGSDDIARRLQGFRDLISSNLLEAELRSACAREGKPFREILVSGFRWIQPSRPLSREMRAALRAGYLRGADLWHVACALHVAPKPSDISFITLDERQAQVAAALKFRLR